MSIRFHLIHSDIKRNYLILLVLIDETFYHIFDDTKRQIKHWYLPLHTELPEFHPFSIILINTNNQIEQLIHNEKLNVLDPVQHNSVIDPLFFQKRLSSKHPKG